MNELQTMEAAAPAAGWATPFDAALACLTEAGVRYTLLRDEPDALAGARDLDVLVDPNDRKVLVPALERAGFLRKLDRRLYRKWLFVLWRNDRFHWIDVHFAFVQGGVEYMDASLAFGRLDRTLAAPRLGVEDRFLHVLLHNLLGKRTLQAKHVPVLRGLHAAGLDRDRVLEQARRYGLEAVAVRALDELETCIADAATWTRLRQTARRALRRRPQSWRGMAQYRWGDRLRPHLDRRPVVLALLGPDGSGKTSFADALQAALYDSPLRAGRIYMGCWGHDLLPMRQVRRLVPPQVSHGRMLLARLGREVTLSPEEQQRLAQSPKAASLAFAALRYALKGTAFHAGLGVEMLWRYLRHVRVSRRSIVVADRWVHDLEFRQGKIPFVHGQRLRQRLYRWFPAPDGILYFQTPYALVERRKPQLDRAQFETMDAVLRRILSAQHPLPITSDAPPDALVRRFLTQHWEALVERCNRRV